MDEQLYLEAKWGERKQAIEECAAHAAELLRQLVAVDSAFDQWYASKGTKSPNEALQRKVEPTVEGLRDLLAQDRNRRDDDKSVIEDLGFGLLLWNGGSQGTEAVLTIKCGAYPEWSAPFSNYCRLDFPSDNPAAKRVLHGDSLRQVMATVVGSWDPGMAWVSSDKMWYAVYPPEHRGQKVFGWLTYISNRYGSLPTLPNRYAVKPLEGLGNLIIINGIDRLTASNPMHVEAVRGLSEMLTHIEARRTPRAI